MQLKIITKNIIESNFLFKNNVINFQFTKAGNIDESQLMKNANLLIKHKIKKNIIKYYVFFNRQTA